MKMPHASKPSFFFFNDTATTEIYTLSLHDALPICPRNCGSRAAQKFHCRSAGRADSAPYLFPGSGRCGRPASRRTRDRKSTRLNSSHSQISYAVFCLKKKKKKIRYEQRVSI